MGMLNGKKISAWVGIGLTVAGIVFGGGAAWAIMQYKIAEAEKDILCLETKLTQTTAVAMSNVTGLATVEEHINNIDHNIEDMTSTLNKMLDVMLNQ